MAGLDGTDTSTTIYIDDLIPTNPDKDDPKSQGDDHIRFIKRVLKNTFDGGTGNGLEGKVTASHTELNILDGATLSTTELNYVDGVTSAIQTQLNAKAPTASPTFTGTVVLPSTTSIGTVTNTDIARLDVTTEGTVEASKVVTANSSNIITIPVGGMLDIKGTLSVDSTPVTPEKLGTPILGGFNAYGSGFSWTGIPDWVFRITIMFDGISTNGTAGIQLLIGDSGGLEQTDYKAGYGVITTADAPTGIVNTTGFQLIATSAAGNLYYGSITLTRMNAGTASMWAAMGTVYTDGTTDSIRYIGGTKTLSGTLDRIALYTTDSWDAGYAGFIYE